MAADTTLDKKVLDRIRKLLSLAQSDNEHEAQVAMTRANDLLLRHNLTLRDVGDISKIIESPAGKDFQFAAVEDKFLIQILEEFFFVKVLYRRWDTGARTSAGQRVTMQRLIFIGEAVNTEVGIHTYDYLLASFRRLWLSYKRSNGASEKSRQAYYHGIFSGIITKLRDQKASVQQETGLVWVGDKALADHMAKKHTVTKANSKGHASDARAQMAGYLAGQDLSLNKGLK